MPPPRAGEAPKLRSAEDLAAFNTVQFTDTHEKAEYNAASSYMAAVGVRLIGAPHMPRRVNAMIGVISVTIKTITQIRPARML